MTGPGEVALIIAAQASIRGEPIIMHIILPTMSIQRLTAAGNVFDSGTYLMLMTGMPSISSVYGFVGMMLL